MWEVKPGNKRGTIRITTLGHKDQPAGWGLSAWHAHGAARDGVSCRRRARWDQSERQWQCSDEHCSCELVAGRATTRPMVPTFCGLASIPLIIKPIDHAVDAAMDASLRPYVLKTPTSD